MEPTEQEAPAQKAEAQEAHKAHAAPPEPKRRGRPPGSKNKPKQDVPTEPAAPKRKPKPPVETPEAHTEAPAEAPAEAPPEAPRVEAPQLTREQQCALRILERQSAYDRCHRRKRIYNLQPLLKRHRELEEARANNWLGERRQAQEGQRKATSLPRSSQATSTWTILCSPATTPTPGPCSTRLCKQFPRTASALPQRPRTRTCGWRGGTKGTGRPGGRPRGQRLCQQREGALHYGPSAQHCRRRASGSGPYRRRGCGACSRVGLPLSAAPGRRRVRSPERAAPSGRGRPAQ